MTAPYASPQALTSFTGELVKSQVMAWKGFSAVSTYPPTSPNFFASDTGRNSVLLNFLHHHLPGYPQVPIHISNTDPVVQHLRTNAEDLGIASEDIVRRMVLKCVDALTSGATATAGDRLRDMLKQRDVRGAWIQGPYDY